MHHVGSFGHRLLQREVELLLAEIARMRRAQRILSGLAAALAPAFEQLPESGLAGLVADEAVLVAQLQAIAIDLQAGELSQAVDVRTGHVGFRGLGGFRLGGLGLHGDRL
jgi:hypothetical protein